MLSVLQKINNLSNNNYFYKNRNCHNIKLNYSDNNHMNNIEQLIQNNNLVEQYFDSENMDVCFFDFIYSNIQNYIKNNYDTPKSISSITYILFNYLVKIFINYKNNYYDEFQNIEDLNLDIDFNVFSDNQKALYLQIYNLGTYLINNNFYSSGKLIFIHCLTFIIEGNDVYTQISIKASLVHRIRKKIMINALNSKKKILLTIPLDQVLVMDQKIKRKYYRLDIPYEQQEQENKNNYRLRKKQRINYTELNGDY